MSAGTELKFWSTGLVIRDFLLENGEGSANDVLRVLRTTKKKTSYNSVIRYFWILKKLGLIQPTRREMGRGPIPKQLYRIVPGMETDDRWSAPQEALYPDTRLGAARYKRAKTKGRIY
jgi:hypothetical protein